MKLTAYVLIVRGKEDTHTTGGILHNKPRTKPPPFESVSSNVFIASLKNVIVMVCSGSSAGLCQLDTGSDVDIEASIDPLLCHFQGPFSSLLRRGNLYSPDPTDTYTGETAVRRL